MATQVVFLFGKPGVGKLTVGEILAAETGYRLLHNHSVVDLVTSLFAFGSPAFVALRERIWLLSIDTCLAAKVSGVIMTFAPEATVTEAFIPALRERVAKRGGQLRFIELRCAADELELRIKDDSRTRFGKLRDVKLFRKLDKEGAFDRPTMPEAELIVDTTKAIPLESTRTIVKHLQKNATPAKVRQAQR